MATRQHNNFCVYQRRTWEEFKRVLSVVHASQPVEGAENLEYRNQMSGLCWVVVYSSSESRFESPCVCVCVCVCVCIHTHTHTFIIKPCWTHLRLRIFFRLKLQRKSKYTFYIWYCFFFESLAVYKIMQKIYDTVRHARGWQYACNLQGARILCAG
jgi:hypothetical protein